LNRGHNSIRKKKGIYLSSARHLAMREKRVIPKKRKLSFVQVLGEKGARNSRFIKREDVKGGKDNFTRKESCREKGKRIVQMARWVASR